MSLLMIVNRFLYKISGIRPSFEDRIFQGVIGLFVVCVFGLYRFIFSSINYSEVELIGWSILGIILLYIILWYSTLTVLTWRVKKKILILIKKKELSNKYFRIRELDSRVLNRFKNFKVVRQLLFVRGENFK